MRKVTYQMQEILNNIYNSLFTINHKGQEARRHIYCAESKIKNNKIIYDSLEKLKWDKN